MKLKLIQEVKFFTLRVAAIVLLSALLEQTVLAQPHLTYTPQIQNLSAPVELKNAGDGTNRLFIAEQGGRIKIYKNGTVLSKPFLDISAITGFGDYQGLWSVAFAPGFKNNRAFFVLYTGINGYTELVRYQASKTNPDTALPSTRAVLFSFPGDVTGGPHFGQMHFGTDGYLYVTLSDGSSPSLTTNFAQNGNSPFGKMLRLNVNVPNAPYFSVPPDNPYITDPNVLDVIWSIGFRNAWRWNFDKRTGAIWIPDVGGNQAEEVNIKTLAQSKGANFGWPCYEANLNYLTTGCGSSNYQFPAFYYPNDSAWGGNCIIGGYVYRGNAFAALKGYYVCSDFISSNAWTIKTTGTGGVISNLQSGVPAGIVCYGEDENSELYAVSIAGTVYRVGAAAAVTANTAPLPSQASAALVSGTRIYPTIVYNNLITAELSGAYDVVHIFDMNGHEVLQQSIKGKKGTISIHLPNLRAGTYIVQLLGKTNHQQKIQIARQGN